MLHIRIHFIFLSLLFTQGLSASTYQSSNLSEFLKAFHENPKSQMLLQPFHENVVLKSKPAPGQDVFKEKIIGNKKKSLILQNDLAYRLVENPQEMVTNIYDLSREDLLKGEVEIAPWSDYYWPIAKGILGNRYADPNAPEEFEWNYNFDFFKEFPIENYVLENSLDLLSPGEKYELLIGDSKGIFTKKHWKEGEYYFEELGNVESWMGICHGWAPASFMMDRPLKSFELKSYDQQHTIKFYPSDVKALASLLWAKAAGPVKFIGGRCDTEEPLTDDETGKVLDPDCFDTNPATWHLVAINQIGRNKLGFVMDATYDYQVWNQPVEYYEVAFFNPQTREEFKTIEGALIDYSEFSDDKFKKFRGARVKKIIGVEMIVGYVLENHPRHYDQELLDFDNKTSVYYRYDLEIDENGDLIGGEWYSYAHPDFLWAPVSNTKAGNDGPLSPNWDVSSPIPLDWKARGKKLARYGMPLAKIVEELISLSRKED